MCMQYRSIMNVEISYDFCKNKLDFYETNCNEILHKIASWEHNICKSEWDKIELFTI